VLDPMVKYGKKKDSLNFIALCNRNDNFDCFWWKDGLAIVGNNLIAYERVIL